MRKEAWRAHGTGLSGKYGEEHEKVGLSKNGKRGHRLEKGVGSGVGIPRSRDRGAVQIGIEECPRGGGGLLSKAQQSLRLVKKEG